MDIKQILQAFMVTGVHINDTRYTVDKYTITSTSYPTTNLILHLGKVEVPITLDRNLSTNEIIQEITNQSQAYLNDIQEIVNMIKFN